MSAVLRSVRIAATYAKVGLAPRYSRALHLNIFEQPRYPSFPKILIFQDLITRYALCKTYLGNKPST
jgi:hypothetical protein